MAPNLTKISTTDILAAVDVPTGVSISPLSLKNRNLAARGHPFLLDVPSNITITPSSAILKRSTKLGDVPLDRTGCFLGFNSEKPLGHHVVPIGKLVGIRFMSIFRFKVWWTTLWVGSSGADVEHESQMILLDKADNSDRPYVVLLPILEGAFRASLQPGQENNIDLCVESGSTKVRASSFRTSVYIQAGDDPFALVREAVRVVRAHLGTFKLLEEKTPPGIVDKFGWCTWDAFYLKVHPQGVWEGVKRLSEGGAPPGLVLIDDGWQSICHDEDDPNIQEGMNLTAAGEQMPCRLTKFQENNKFKDYESPKSGLKGMKGFVSDLKEEFASIEHVYVWHALCGYWGGLRPQMKGLPEAKVVEPKLTPGLEKTMEDLAVDKIVSNGVGLVAPERVGELYQGLHSHLEAAGIDGVKVDVIHLLEMLCEDYGGRVELAKAYYKALTESVRKHFKGNGVIASMEHCNDFMLLGTEAISLGRVGDDFWCTDPAGDPNGTFWLQGCHMVHCAYNSLWMGNFIHPDWDMFQSTHPCAAFHAASRAISGGPIYVSDSVGCHDFELLKSLVLPDGTILRCDHYALPTRDCLFEDPLHDGRTMLKIWNVNKFTGVLGAFNCQGGGWSPQDRKNKCASEYSHSVTTKLRPSDIEWKNGKSPIAMQGVKLFAVYSFRAKKMALLRPDADLGITLDPFNFELFVVSPVNILSWKRNIQFAPIGLVNMLNTGGAIQSVQFKDEINETDVKIVVKGVGELKAYSSEMPVSCLVDGKEVRFGYEEKMVAVEVPWTGSSSKPCIVEYLY